MRLVRKAAVWVAGFGVRHASRQGREWAEGLAREVEFVEGDWRALGTLRVVSFLRVAPPASLRNVEEVARAGRQFAGNREHVPPVLMLTWGLQAITYGLSLLGPRHHRLDAVSRVGYAVAVAGAVYLAIVAWLESRMGERPADMDDLAWAEFYRAEMERLRDLYAGFGRWMWVAMAMVTGGPVLRWRSLRPNLLYVAAAEIGVLAVAVLVRSSVVGRFQGKMDAAELAIRGAV